MCHNTADSQGAEMSPILLLALLQGLLLGTYGSSLCGIRMQFAGGGFLQYHGGFGDDTVIIENRLDGLIVKSGYLPSTNLTLQSLPGNYIFCVHWFPALRTFILKYGVQNYSWHVMERSNENGNTFTVLSNETCPENTTMSNMSFNWIKQKNSCRFVFPHQNWNSTKFVDHEISEISQLLDKPGVATSGRVLRRWIDKTLSGVQFKGNSHHFGNGTLQASVFKLNSVDVLRSIPKKMGISVSVPKQVIEKAGSGKRLHVVTVHGTSVFKDAANSTVLGDKVIGVSVENTKVSNLCEDIMFNFEHEPVKTNLSPVCVFWNESTDGWSTFGCRTFPKENHTQCNCSHLTYFAVLMQYSSQKISEEHLVSLSVLTFVGCTISFLAALFTICWNFCTRKTHLNPTLNIHMNLLGAVLLLDFCFMSSAVLGAFDLPSVCKGSGMLLHFAQLCMFTWMGIEGFNLYRLVVKVFDSTSFATKKLAVIGWGFPALIVLVIFLVDFEYYGLYSINVDRPSSCNSRASICWLTEPIIHKVVNLGYFGIVFLFNCGMLTVMVVRVLHLMPHNRREQTQYCVTLLGLIFMLGLPWGIAFFSFGAVYLPVQYLFSILNSLQGLFIFFWYWALSQPHVKHPSRSLDSSSATPASPRSDQSTLMSDHKKLLT
ncbi:adhesion G-protein coupled receptor G1-like isoform X3 [Xenopus laevis]|uniref:Adhesion G-protein coupled receptor G1 n=1 Tax=Xenopus laevis TaxID=8355 RepID=A0A8J1KLR5_XENLA|nr:adhesion G-protein coupled receptor G1-like isoform X3 [Xenopus laevis]